MSDAVFELIGRSHCAVCLPLLCMQRGSGRWHGRPLIPGPPPALADIEMWHKSFVGPLNLPESQVSNPPHPSWSWGRGGESGAGGEKQGECRYARSRCACAEECTGLNISS